MHVEDILYIEASVEDVWAATVAVERWPEWLPTVTSVERLDEGPLGLGSRARIKQPGQPAAEWVVTSFAAGEQFTWTTERTGLRMVATHALAPQGAGTTNRLRVEVTGGLGVLLWPVLGPAIRWALRQENAALSRRCAGDGARATM